jgi:hypothetical protein
MGLILLAGVLSVRQLPSHLGGGTVQGLVVLQASSLDALALRDVQSRWPAALLEWRPVGPEPLAPFDGQFLRERSEAGDATVLLVAPRSSGREGRNRLGWGVLIDEALEPAASPGDNPALKASLDFVHAQDGLRAFVLGVLPGELSRTALDDFLLSVAATALQAPEYRRTTIVVLGARQAGAQQTVRWCLMIPMGGWSPRARPGLDAVLDGSW